MKSNDNGLTALELFQELSQYSEEELKQMTCYNISESIDHKECWVHEYEDGERSFVIC